MSVTLLLGWLTLALSVGWGYQLARRVFAERDPFSLAPISLGLAWATLLFSGAYLRRWLAPESLALPTACLLGLGIALLSRCSAPPLEKSPLSLASRIFFLLGWPLVLIYALFELTTGMVVDGDFFAHVANIGLFEEGHYPPLIFFLGLPAGGHYGHQLLAAQFARFSGFQFLTADWILASMLALISFTLLFCLLREQTGSQNQAMLGTGMAFFAANTGSRIGLADALGNHNPVAYFMLILATWSVLRALREGGWSMPAAALVLGSEAMVYEIHFGLIGLTMPLMVLVAPVGQRWVTFKRVVAVGFMALVVAITIGGAFTDLATRRSSESQAWRQQVSVKIPKKELFMLRGDNVRPSRPFEGKMRSWKADFSPTQSYLFALGPRIRDLFWYPTWLAPLAFVLCLFRRHRVGVWFGGLAFFAWLVPSLTDFGSFEGEALRWLFVTSVSGSILFGVAVGMLWDRRRPQWWGVLGLATVLWFSSAGLVRSVSDLVEALKSPGQQLPIGRPGIVPGVGLIPKPFPLLSYHYGLSDDEFQAAEWIRRETPRQARILADDDDDSPNRRSVMIGLEGRLPAGYLPQVTHANEPSNYRKRLQIEEFWRNADSRLLAGLGVDWLLVHSPRTIPETGKGLKLAKEIGKIKIYSVHLEAPEAPVEMLTVEEASLEQHKNRRCVLKIQGRHSASRPLEWVTVGFINHEGQLVGGPQWRPIQPWPAQSSDRLSLEVISPFEAGLYQIVVWGGRAQGDEPSASLPKLEVLRLANESKS